MLKLTRKMSGFISQKVRSRARIVSAVKVGTLGMSCRLMSRREWRRKDMLCYMEDIRTQRTVEESHLPVLVSTIMALAQHLKEASTAPIATDSVGSRVR